MVYGAEGRNVGFRNDLSDASFQAPHELKTLSPRSRHAGRYTEAVDALMKSLRHPAASEIQALRATILQAHPSIREGVKWNAPSFRTGEYFATTNLRTKSGVGVVLHFGAKVRSVAASRESIKDPQKLLKWVAKDRATANLRT